MAETSTGGIKMNENKLWWTSKTLWVNAIAAGAIVFQGLSGRLVIDAEAQVALLALINLGLRLWTKKPVNWK